MLGVGNWGREENHLSFHPQFNFLDCRPEGLVGTIRTSLSRSVGYLLRPGDLQSGTMESFLQASVLYDTIH